MRTRGSLGLRVVAGFEAAKGVVVLLAGFGVLLLIHRDVQAVAERLVVHLHLNPANRYPRIFLRAATESTPGHLRLLALGAFGSSVMRFIEAAGVWRERRWAEWFAVATGLIYVPFEAAAVAHRADAEPVVALLLNLAIVSYMGIRLQRGTRIAA